MSVFCEAAELPSNLKNVTKMENKTGLEKLLDSLVHQSVGCNQNHRASERYILSGIIDYTKKLIEEEKAEGLKYHSSEVSGMIESYWKGEKRAMTDSIIQFEIKLNAGKQKGETVFVQTDIDELKEEDLSSILIRHGYLENWCNNDEYTVVNREFI